MSSVTVACRCGSVNLPINEQCPGKTELCHCDSCRHTTGALFAGWIGPLSSAPPEDVLRKCTAYRSSPTHERFFCSTCGTKTFIHYSVSSTKADDATGDQKNWIVFGGAVDPPEGVDKVMDVQSNEWICDAADGGMAPFLTTLDGADVPTYRGNRDSEKLSAAALSGLIKSSGSHLRLLQHGQRLKAECRCGGVSLRVERANPEITLERCIARDADGKPTGKHMAYCCVCRHCRLHSGVSLTPWVYVPPVHVVNPHTNKAVAQHKEVETDAGREANEGLTLTYYWSSPDACRSFCSKCGASVFFSCDRRPEIVNIAAGLLRAEEGPMARRWVSWQWGRTAWWKEGTTQRDVMEAWQATAHRRDVE